MSHRYRQQGNYKLLKIETRYRQRGQDRKEYEHLMLLHSGACTGKKLYHMTGKMNKEEQSERGRKLRKS